MDRFEIFLVVAPGLEPLLEAEAREAGFDVSGSSPGGVTIMGGWTDLWRANLTLRGATRILVRLASFRALHLAQLDKRARKLPWSDWFDPKLPLRIEATCRKSRIYHNRAAAQRIEGALTAAGFLTSADAALTLKLRIEDDLCTLSIDTSGESLHKRGLKAQVNKAPMRETLAALFLRACGYTGTEPVLDPMCGSGTFLIEAAEIATGQHAGRVRGFAFEHLASFDAKAFEALKPGPPAKTDLRFSGFDRDQGAIRIAAANAEQAGHAQRINLTCAPISAAEAPPGPPGLVIVNPPYGGRIGNRKLLFGLYAALGERMKTQFRGWRFGMVTSDGGLAKACGLKWSDIGPPVDHGGQKIKLYQAQL